MESALTSRPDWDRLYEVAAGQAGYFSTAQAAQSGYSVPLLIKHMTGGRVVRVIRGVYRLVHFPVSEWEDVVPVWLWSGMQGVFSHRTALVMHGLSDLMPGLMHLTLPIEWRARRLRVPGRTVLHFATVQKKERVWIGAVPVTSVVRTIRDCAEAHVERDMVMQAWEEATARGMLTGEESEELGRVMGTSQQGVRT